MSHDLQIPRRTKKRDTNVSAFKIKISYSVRRPSFSSVKRLHPAQFGRTKTKCRFHEIKGLTSFQWIGVMRDIGRHWSHLHIAVSSQSGLTVVFPPTVTISTRLPDEGRSLPKVHFSNSSAMKERLVHVEVSASGIHFRLLGVSKVVCWRSNIESTSHVIRRMVANTRYQIFTSSKSISEFVLLLSVCVSCLKAFGFLFLFASGVERQQWRILPTKKRRKRIQTGVRPFREWSRTWWADALRLSPFRIPSCPECLRDRAKRRKEQGSRNRSNVSPPIEQRSKMTLEW